MESRQHGSDVLPGQSTGRTRVPDQKVPMYRSDRWIVLKLFSRVSGCCFPWSSIESRRNGDDVLLASPPARPEYRITRSLTIDLTVGSQSNVFHEFPLNFIHGVWNRYDTKTTSGQAIPPPRQECRIKRSISLDPNVGSRSNFFHEFPEAVSYGVAWNRDDTRTTSCRASPPAEPEYRIKRSLSIDPTVGSRLNFFHEFPEAVGHGVGGIGTAQRRCPVRPTQQQDQRIGSKGPYL
ncbi:hypothetical protein D5086_005880 [Populus alba]|uniref:Uncharacterized protein n=1 Tax=Populus alba TaxID=43335 RepID=A0ACC4CVS0_POPAL